MTVTGGTDSIETLAAIRELTGVREAVVTRRAGPDGRVVLLAYLTGPDPQLGTAVLRQQLLHRLPDTLIPDHLTVLDELPLGADGEYDLGALPDPGPESAAVATAHVAPRTPMEQQIADEARQILGVERVGVHDSFFALGGSSLQAFRLSVRIKEIFDVDLTLQEVFATPTVDGLAQLVVRTLGERFGARKVKKHRWRDIRSALDRSWRRVHGLLPLTLRRWVPPGVPCGKGGPQGAAGPTTS